MNLADHMERFLGRIETGWNEASDGPLPYKLVCFNYKGYRVLSTLGLSDHLLSSDVASKRWRQELIFVVNESTGRADEVLTILSNVASVCLSRHAGLARGQLVGPYDINLHGKVFPYLYSTSASFLPDEFSPVLTERGRVGFVWLVPITRSEADFVRMNGWELFEDLLEMSEADLGDPERQPVA